MSARFLGFVVCCAVRTGDLLLRRTGRSGPVAQGKGAGLTRRDGHCVGDGDALPGGRGSEGCRDTRGRERGGGGGRQRVVVRKNNNTQKVSYVILLRS